MEERQYEVESKVKKYEAISREHLVQRIEVMEQELVRLIRENYSLRGREIQPTQLDLFLQDQISSLQDQLYGSKSEKYKKSDKSKESNEPRKPRVQKPSERYPNLPVRINKITMDPAPQCQSCGEVMFDSGLTEDSQQITVIPKKYEIIETQRVTYKCSCQGCLHTAPAPLKIKESSTYSNEMILDVVLSKYCDLIPVERYAAMASRSGVIDLPPHSLIEITHYFADFAREAYLLLQDEALHSRVLRADETPHRMLEGGDKKSWYLWGFSTDKVCFFECHNTRSGDVASSILENSNCEVLLTDVYSGYGKAIRLANQTRVKNKQPLIKSANCNAHSRRYFFKYLKLHGGSEDAKFYVEKYVEIYKLNAETKGKSPPEVLALREQMSPHFESMREKVLKDLHKYPSDNKLSKAMYYFLDNYTGLTYFIEDPDVPIDNNSQESLLRNYVVGRKTWYGTHSERGAESAAILFSLVESCRLNKVNPREYFKELTQDLLCKKEPYTPYDYLIKTTTNTTPQS